LERRPLSLPQRIARQAALIAITLSFTGVVAYAGYIEGL
jgi:cbb3-type cytochrome oxidase subunit 3